MSDPQVMPNAEQPHDDASTRDRVARSILEHGPSTAAELAERLRLTPAAVRRHLTLLLAAGRAVVGQVRPGDLDHVQCAQAELALATPRGDTATTITIPTTGDATGINTWTSYTEYGQPKQPTNTTPGGTTGIGYNWLGTKQRATLEIGLTLMGARLYNQTTGLFTSIDPVHQGNETSYGYPSAPTCDDDISGEFRVSRIFFSTRSWYYWVVVVYFNYWETYLLQYYRYLITAVGALGVGNSAVTDELAEYASWHATRIWYAAQIARSKGRRLAVYFAVARPRSRFVFYVHHGWWTW
jgi:hypothetical protein